MTTKIVHCKKEPYDVYIGRPSKWANPFKIGIHGNRHEVVEKYEEWLLGVRSAPGYERPSLEEARKELTGKTLGCWCAPKKCHGDVLKRFLEIKKMKYIGIIGTRKRDCRADFLAIQHKFFHIYKDGDIIVSGGCTDTYYYLLRSVG